MGDFHHLFSETLGFVQGYFKKVMESRIRRSVGFCGNDLEICDQCSSSYAFPMDFLKTPLTVSYFVFQRVNGNC